MRFAINVFWVETEHPNRYVIKFLFVGVETWIQVKKDNLACHSVPSFLPLCTDCSGNHRGGNPQHCAGQAEAGAGRDRGGEGGQQQEEEGRRPPPQGKPGLAGLEETQDILD